MCCGAIGEDVAAGSGMTSADPAGIDPALLEKLTSPEMIEIYLRGGEAARARPSRDLSLLSLGLPSGLPSSAGSADWEDLLGQAVRVANSLNPVSDINDAVTGSERFSQGILAGDPWEAASGFIDTAGGLLGMLVPGTFSQYKEGTDTVRRAVDDIVTPRPSGAATRDGIDAVDTAPRGLLGDAATGDRGGLLGYTGVPSTGAEYAAGSGASAAPAAGEAALAGSLSSDPGRLVAGERSAAGGTGVAGAGTSPGILSDPYVSWSRLPPGGQRSLGSGPWVTQGRPVADDFSAAERRVAPPGTMTDPEGRPIVAPIVVGQHQPGGPDIPIDFRDIFALLQPLGVTDLRFVPPDLIGGKGGKFNYTTGIASVADGMSPRETLETAMHEVVSHGTDETIDADFLPKAVNRMPTDDLIAGWPLAQTREATQGVAPDVWADDPRHAALPEELRANSLAGYGIDPEQFKRRYPGVAKAVRDQWNSHPVLSRFLQFNSLAGLGLGLPLSALLGLGAFGGGAGGSAEDDGA